MLSEVKSLANNLHILHLESLDLSQTIVWSPEGEEQVLAVENILHQTNIKLKY